MDLNRTQWEVELLDFYDCDYIIEFTVVQGGGLQV